MSYLTVAEARRRTKISESSISDAGLQDWLDDITSQIDSFTGRTWQAVTTVTTEYYNGSDTDTLWLRRGDIVSVTSLQIDDDADGTFTTETEFEIENDAGIITLKTGATITRFPSGINLIRVSYTYGAATPIADVKVLTALMLWNYFQFDENRERLINGLINKLKRKVARPV